MSIAWNHPDCNGLLSLKPAKSFFYLKGISGRTSVTPGNHSSHLDECRIQIPECEGEGYYEFVRISPGLLICISNFVYSGDRVEKFNGDDLLIFNFKINGMESVSFSNRAVENLAGPASCVIVHPKGFSKNHRIPAGIRERAVTLYCKQSYFRALIGEGFDAITSAVIEDWSGASKRPVIVTLPLTSAMSRAATEIVESKYRGKIRQVYFEAKSLELLCIITSVIKSFRPPVHTSIRLRRSDVAKLYEAQQFLIQMQKSPPTIRQLARHIGINESKLKFGFKAIFGTTVFEFIQSERMRKALELLQDQELSVSQVADEVGYGYANNFSQTFKRYFGFSPKVARNAQDGVKR
jgi:AraC-like DNA-binding protein